MSVPHMRAFKLGNATSTTRRQASALNSNGVRSIRTRHGFWLKNPALRTRFLLAYLPPGHVSPPWPTTSMTRTRSVYKSISADIKTMMSALDRLAAFVLRLLEPRPLSNPGLSLLAAYVVLRRSHDIESFQVRLRGLNGLFAARTPALVGRISLGRGRFVESRSVKSRDAVETRKWPRECSMTSFARSGELSKARRAAYVRVD